MLKNFNSRRLVELLVVAATSFTLSVSTQAYAATPSSADLAFTYSGESGVLVITHTLNRTPSKSCRFTLRGELSYDGLTMAAARKSVNSRRNTKAKVIRMRVYNLPGVAPSDDSRDPILTLQARTVCGKREIVSNAFARYVKCGRGTNGVGPSRFLTLVSRGIQ